LADNHNGCRQRGEVAGRNIRCRNLQCFDDRRAEYSKRDGMVRSHAHGRRSCNNEIAREHCRRERDILAGRHYGIRAGCRDKCRLRWSGRLGRCRFNRIERHRFWISRRNNIILVEFLGHKSIACQKTGTACAVAG
jgi:hypothetical protein